MVATVLTLLWRQVPGVQELTRLLARKIYCGVVPLTFPAIAIKDFSFQQNYSSEHLKIYYRSYNRMATHCTQRPLPDSVKFT